MVVMLSEKALHCLLLWTGARCGHAVVVRGKVGFGKRRGLWSERFESLVRGVREEVMASYGMLAAVVETNSGIDFVDNDRTVRKFDLICNVEEQMH